MSRRRGKLDASVLQSATRNTSASRDSQEERNLTSPDLSVILRSDFYSFVRRAFRAINEREKLKDPYIPYLCYRLAKIGYGESRRVICNLPPRHLKTFISCCLAAWIMGRNPRARIMVVSYGEELAKMITRQIRDIIGMDWYKEAFPRTRLARDHTSVTNFGTTKLGEVRAFSIEGGITGFGSDYIIVDDPLEIQDADNFQQIDRVNALFDSKVRTRLNDPETGCILVIAHRLNEEDLCGHIMKEDDWDHVVLPFMAERNESFVFGDERWSRKRGGLLRESFRQDVKRIASQPNYHALYQQSPRAGGIPRITPSHFSIHQPSGAPCSLRVISIDPGEQQGERNSYSVLQIWQVIEAGYFLENLSRMRVRYDELRSICKKLIRHIRPSAILIEETGIGIALLDDLKAEPWQDVVRVRPRQSKIERLRKHASVIRARKIFLPPGAPWRDDYVQEFISFPNCKFTDQVDATTQFLEYVATDPILREPPARAIFGAAFGSNPQYHVARARNQSAKDPSAPGIIQVAPPSCRWRYRW